MRIWIFLYLKQSGIYAFKNFKVKFPFLNAWNMISLFSFSAQNYFWVSDSSINTHFLTKYNNTNILFRHTITQQEFAWKFFFHKLYYGYRAFFDAFALYFILNLLKEILRRYLGQIFVELEKWDLILKNTQLKSIFREFSFIAFHCYNHDCSGVSSGAKSLRLLFR